MRREPLSLIGLLALQVVAVVLYTPAFFQRAPQSVVLPPACLIFFALALVGMNTGILTPTAGRSSLVFVQGVNITMRSMMLFANLRGPNGEWDGLLILATLVSIAASWFTITQMEKRPPRFLLLRQRSAG